MLRFTNRLRLELIIPAILVIVTTTTNATSIKAPKDRAMSTLENSQWTTHCVGRFLIDLPAEAEYVGGNYEYAFATVEQQPMEQSAFQQEVDKIEARLKDEKHKSGTPLLLKKATPKQDTHILGFWGNENRSSVVEISGYRWLNGMRYLVHKRADRDKLDSAVSRMGTTMSMLQSRATDAPTARGFCVEQAIFADEGSSANESLNMRFRLKGHADIVVDVATNLNGGAPPESLLSRKPGVLSGLGVLGATLGGIRNIKEGDRTIGDHPGQEWLLKAPNDHGQMAHLFTWEAPGLHDDALHPQIRFDLQSGNFDGGLDPRPISLTDKQMLELWDKILNSLRLRPTDDGKRSTTENQKSPPGAASTLLPLGELARTGTVCPQTGYWQCPENDLQGSTRLFQAGDVMPAAVVKRDLSLIERLKGTSDQHSTHTVWRLMRYGEATQLPMASSSANAPANHPSGDA